MIMLRRALTLVALCLATAAPGTAQETRLTLADLGREVGLSDPRLSPDGAHVALVVRRTNYDENRFERSIVLVDLRDGTRRDLTPGRDAAFAPRWSPAGHHLAFLSEPGDDEATQLYVLPMTGGEAVQVTSAPEGIQSYRWRPDGGAFAFLTADEAPARTGEERHNRSFEVGYNVYLAEESPQSSHAWVIDAEGGEARRITSGTRSVVDLEWTRDGDALLLQTQPRPHSGEALQAQLLRVAVDTGEERTVIAGPTVIRGFLVSPDGSQLAWGHYQGREPYFHPADLSVVPVNGGTSRLITGDLDRNVSGATWLPDGDGFLLSGTDGTRAAMWRLPLDGPPVRVNLGRVDPASNVEVHPGGGIVFLGREPDRPTELYHLSGLDAEPRRITDFNAELASRTLGRTETLIWNGPDGFRENGVLVYPPDFRADRTYPLVLNIHGGPMGVSTEGWSTFNQLLAAEGWIVFSPNYRGSSNMGDAFQSAVINDAGDGPGRDVMAGIEALRSRGFIDEGRIAVSGWSYGGYMTAWLTAHYQIWRAAVAGAAVTDWFDWYSLADMNVWAGYGLGGSPWLNDNAENYWRQSPMAYAHQIRTPTLILSTTGDPRVTVTQSYKLYHALRDNGVPVQFIAYPTGGHFPPDPVHQRDVRRRWIEWIRERFLAPRADGGP